MSNYKIAMATFRTSQCQEGDEVNEVDVRAQKDTLENLNTRKSTSRRILTGFLSKNSELKPNLSSKRLRECRSSEEFSIDTIQDTMHKACQKSKTANVIRHP